MAELNNQAAQDLTGLPPVYVEVPDKSGMPGAGTSRLLNTGLTEAEATDAAEPAPPMFATTGQQRRHTLLGVSGIVPWLIAGGLLSVYSNAERNGQTEDAARALIWLALLIPCGIAFGVYLQWRNRQRRKDYQKRHQAWVARFVGNWPLRERLVDVDAIPDVWQRVTSKTMADTLEADRVAILAQGMPAAHQASAELAGALAAVSAWARAPWSDPALYRSAEGAVDRVGELAGRRRADAGPPAPPSTGP